MIQCCCNSLRGVDGTMVLMALVGCVALWGCVGDGFGAFVEGWVVGLCWTQCICVRLCLWVVAML